MTKTHNIKTLYDRTDGATTVYGWMCTQCETFMATPEEADYRYSEPCPHKPGLNADRRLVLENDLRWSKLWMWAWFGAFVIQGVVHALVR